MDEGGFKAFIERRRWQKAKSTFVPHEYTVNKWGDRHEFDEAVTFIEKNGFLARWMRKEPNYYYDLDGMRYWVLQPVLNRQVIGSKNSEVSVIETGEIV